MRGPAVSLLLLLFLLAGCAYIGEPLPPALRIPEPVRDLRAVQRGDKIVIDFTPPATTTEGLPRRDKDPDEVDLRINDQRVDRVTPAAPWTGQTVQISVRIAGPRGRWSAPSNTVTLAVIAPLAPAQSVTARAHPKGVELAWQSAATARISRDGVLLAASSTSPYLDTTAEYGKSYRYGVQSIQKAGTGFAEADPSPEVEITARDTFAPDAPSGLRVLAGVASAELGWERVDTPDLAFYRVYRDGTLLADRVPLSSYSDSRVTSGRLYRYTVTAVDQNQNESPRSAAVELTFP